MWAATRDLAQQFSAVRLGLDLTQSKDLRVTRVQPDEVTERRIQDKVNEAHRAKRLVHDADRKAEEERKRARKAEEERKRACKARDADRLIKAEQEATREKWRLAREEAWEKRQELLAHEKYLSLVGEALKQDEEVLAKNVCVAQVARVSSVEPSL